MHDYSQDPDPLTDQDWMDAKKISQVTVQVDEVLAQSIQSKLAADHREDGSRGRSLTANIGSAHAGVCMHVFLSFLLSKN